MLKINFLRNIFLLSLLLSVGLPLYDYFYIFPSYSNLLVRQSENEATRFVRFLVATKELDSYQFSSNPIDPWVTREISRMKDDSLLVKLRIFSPDGMIAYSTKEDEIGHLNQNDYFVNQVAKGVNYSKVVHKDQQSAEGDRLARDVVETYVPIMVDGRFHGAVEVYYDLTREQASLNALTRHSRLLLISFSLAFLLLMLMALRRGKTNFLALRTAERNLQLANETLESRVTLRTEQLQGINLQLSDEIKERIKAEQALKAALESVSDARDKINAILASVADGLVVSDRQQRVVLMNPVAESIFAVKSWSPGMHLADLISHPELLDKIAEARQCLDDGLPGEFDLNILQTTEAGQRIYSARTSVLRSDEGEPRGTVILLQDVTKDREIERMKSEFVSMAAHELRTPLTMILGYSELLIDHQDFTPQQTLEFLRVINDKAIALSAIVDDLLDVTRIEEGRQLALVKKHVDLKAVLDKALEEVRLRADETHQFVVQCPAGPIDAEVDKERFHQVLQNLLSNAVKYSPEGGQICLSLIANDGIQLSVSDQGIGMRPDQLELAFDRFYRADPSDSGIRGTGLGLSIVKYIVEAHGGRVQIESEWQKGTKVSCWFPG